MDNKKKENHLAGDTIFFLVGKKKTGDLLFVSDQNFNRTMYDDSIVTVSNFFHLDTITWLSQIQNRIKYMVYFPFRSQYVQRIIPLTMDVDIYKNPEELKKPKSDKAGNVQLNVVFSNGYKYGCFKKGLMKYCIISDDLIRAGITNVPAALASQIYIYKSKVFKNLSKVDHRAGYRMHDTLQLGRREWVFSHQSYEGDTVSFSRIAKRKTKWGNREGEIAVDFVKKDIHGNTVHSDSLFQKPVLFIFWGWWCTPCLKQLPQYVAFFDSIKNQSVNFLGVALDKPEDIEFTMEEIRNHEIQWPTVISNIRSKEKSELANLFRVDAVSTYMVTDNKRKIIYKGHDFEKAKQVILMILNNQHE